MGLNTRVVALCGGLVLAVGLLAIPTGAQEPKGKAKAAPPPRSAEPAKVAHPPGVHVPNYFNQLEPPLTPEQRERIYEIQARALRDCEAVLTAAQRSSLQEHRARAGKSARDEEAPGDEPPPKRAVRKKAG